VSRRVEQKSRTYPENLYLYLDLLSLNVSISLTNICVLTGSGCWGYHSSWKNHEPSSSSARTILYPSDHRKQTEPAIPRRKTLPADTRAIPTPESGPDQDIN